MNSTELRKCIPDLLNEVCDRMILTGNTDPVIAILYVVRNLYARDIPKEVGIGSSVILTKTGLEFTELEYLLANPAYWKDLEERNKTLDMFDKIPDLVRWTPTAQEKYALIYLIVWRLKKIRAKVLLDPTAYMVP